MYLQRFAEVMAPRRSRLLGASMMVLLLAAAGAVQAQTTPSGAAPGASPDQTASEVTELTVTATRREAVNVLNIAESVDAYPSQALQTLNIYSMSDLSKIDPSLDIVNEGAVSERIIIRGVSSDVGATTGVYVDETPLEGGFNDTVPGDNTPQLAVQDIDHVEVLKGPQGTLFGAGSMDGTVRVITNQPKLDSYGGWIEGSIAGVNGGNAYYDAGGAINLPVVKDTFGLRIAGWGDDGGGYIDQTISGHTNRNVNDVHLYGFRAEALWQVNDRLSFLGTASYQNTRVDGAEDWNRFIGGLVSPNSPYIGPFAPYNNVEPSQTPYWQEFQLYSITGRYRFDFGSVIENTSYGYKNELHVSDTSAQDCGFNICQGNSSFPATYNSHPWFKYITEDVRFVSDFKGPFSLVAGVYYEGDRQVYQGSVVNANPLTGMTPCYTYDQCSLDGLVKPGHGHNVVQFSTGSRQTTDQVAIYGQADYKILPTLTLTVGLRYFTANIENQELTFQNIAPTVAPYGFDGGYVLGVLTKPYVASSDDGHEKQPTYNFSINWNATPDISFYARAASGFRLGGINESAAIASQAGVAIPAQFGPDSLWDYEAGAKAYLMDHRLYVGLTVYHIDWSNEQETAEAQGTFGYTLNVGKSSIDGVELATSFRPIPDLTLSGGLTYVNAVLAQDLPASVADSGTPGHKGDALPFVPHLSLTAQGEYDHHFNDTMTGYLAANLSYHSSSFSAFELSAPGGPIPADYDTELPAYFLMDLKAGVRWDKYDFSVYVQNVTNVAAWLAADTSNGGVLVHSPRPRTVGVRLAAKF